MSADFKTGLFGCCSHMPSCLDTFFCYCCQTSRQCQAVAGNRDNMDTMQCLILCCCAETLPFFACQIRSRVVEKYKIDEGGLFTCLKGCCCYSCSLCQTHRELSLRGDYPGGAMYVKEPMTMN